MAILQDEALKIFATNRHHARFCEDAVDALSSSVRKRVTLRHGTTWKTTPFDHHAKDDRILVVSRLADFGLNDLAPHIGRLSQYLMFTELLPPEAIAARVPRLRVGGIHRLHLANEQSNSNQASLVKRLITGVASPGQGSILDAWWEFDDSKHLVVISPEYARLSVPLHRLEGFIGIDKKKLANFQVDDEGDFVYWAHADVHFGWDELEALIDPVKAAGAKTRNKEFAVRFGNAIRLFRDHKRLSQSQIEGIDARHLRRIEHGEVALSPKAIRLLATAHDLEPSRYLGEVAKLIS